MTTTILDLPSVSAPRGVQTWNLRVYDPSGNLRRLPLGRFPNLGTAAARKAARSERARVEAGHDPVAEKKAKREAGAELQAGVGTLRSVIDLYEQQGDPPRTWFTGAGRRRVERVFATLLPKPVAAMKPSDVHRVVDSYPGSKIAAQNSIHALKLAFTWAVRRDYVPASLLTVSPGQGVPKRTRVLTAEDLKRVLPVLRAGEPAHGPAMLFMALTLARCNKVAGAKWGEIDLAQATWTIPPERQKNTARGRERKPMVVPLSFQALALLHRLRPEGGNPAPSRLVFAALRGRPPINWDRAQKQIFQASKTGGWHRHDLRRTGATMMGEAGIPPHVVEAALNHVTIHSALAGRYNTSRYYNEVKEALQVLARRYDVICSEWYTQPDEYGEAEQVWGVNPVERAA